MAGSASGISLPNSSFFNIYTDGGPVARTSPAPVLPGGRCNFVDLSHGANGPKCGCRRFWSRGTGGPGGFSGYSNGDFAGTEADQVAWCMCSHHACYHDDDTQGGQVATVTTLAADGGQENERPRINREPLTPVVQELSFQMPPVADQSRDFHTINNASFGANIQGGTYTPQGETATPAPEPSLPDTLSWSNFTQTPLGQQKTSPLPPIPSQCLLSSQPSSTTSSARIAYHRPFAGTGLQTFSGVKSKLREAQLNQDDDISPPNKDAVTPSQLSDTVQGHELRLDRLEHASFSNDHEDCHEKHDQADLRVTELESRVEEMEKMLNDSSSTTSRHHHFRATCADESAASTVSVSTDASGHTDRAELFSQLQALKAQLSQLQGLSSFPSYTRPWEVEVVFLPFPLKGVWLPSRDFPSQRRSGGDGVNFDQWTQLPDTVSAMEPSSPGFNEWIGPELQSDWLLPRACAPNKMVDKRLRSRGLVKNVLVRGPDARSIEQAISAAFGTLFRTLSRMQANVSMHSRVHQYLGIQQPWVPLRKVHKDSRLRFLSPAEMVTPAMWDVSFLSSSVVMKATGVHRLFITQPEAYLQDLDAYDNGWSWHRLRELSRVYPDSQSSQQDVPEADAMEDCWAWNDKLDEHPSSPTTSQFLSLRQAEQPRFKSASMSPSQQHFLMGRSPSLSISRTRAQSPLVPLNERKPSVSRPPRVRTTSMPPALPPMSSPSQAQRRLASARLSNIHPYPYDGRLSPQLTRTNMNMGHSWAITKRTRSSRSPSGPVSARMRNTPRWITASPSPIPEGFVHGGGGNSAACRQTTPLYYATPYSNAPYVDTRHHRGVIEPDDDEGSGTNSYDMADVNNAHGSEDDESSGYEDDSVMLDLGHPRTRNEDDEDWQEAQHPLPEDEPWPGIEDEENRDPEALALEAEKRSRQSSVPSEYPSTQRAWTAGQEEFSVFEDGDGGR
ncbi:uncharacterized protein BCR38DRAFT_342340 [Pseudomassariella vexata]|uniref:Uncharacterized protein n=1 Tax=Pseudomassariella vexata TaxID=1141098 RepID=A0A1Y2E1K8_9PEZI|nr:uncharacterized protein BCR38DRAFT_342340 [Pseudomassariella vexata]ORY65412.1 hypothetical protein BCR38DRAFT_342340 [Pseudomassariella vexata]